MNDEKYLEFLATKETVSNVCGFDVSLNVINNQLFNFEKAITKWALSKGKAAVFADCGLGKTIIQLEWANQIQKKENKPILIIAPLAVSKQTKREGEKFEINVNICKRQSDVSNGINITNYEMLKHFSPDDFTALVLDESSILKGFDGKYKQMLIEFAQPIQYRLACTATPAPNDITEIINHAEFLSIMSGKEILSMFFIQDGNSALKWRLKRHAYKPFWKWLASWSVAIRKPSDLGYADKDFVLPPLNMHSIIVKSSESVAKNGAFFAVEASTLQERQQTRRDSIDARIKAIADIVNQSDEQWLIWCNLNSESEMLKKEIFESVEIKGADSAEYKESNLIGFQTGKIKKLITKPTIAGFGMNFQTCHNVAFVGLSDSYEQYYQAVRRCYRFGQKSPVNVYIVYSDLEGAVVRNIQRKEADATNMMNEVVSNMNDQGQVRTKKEIVKYVETKEVGNDWTMYLGDSVLAMKNVPDDSCGLSVFSPPFPGMYVYTNSPHDVGNTKNIQELIDQLKFVVDQDHLFRILMPGRSCCIHLTQAIAHKNLEGYIGIKDFRGKVIEMMESAGWVYYGEVCIDKDPQIKAIRTKDRGLMFKTLAKDSSLLHPALADYLLQFVKPGDNPNPIQAASAGKYTTSGWITPDEWIEWAAPVWYKASNGYPGGIRETDVLNNYKKAKGNEDEKHLCPLQLGVIERAIKLWSAPGETVFSPFAGIGSEGYVALQLERKFIGCELKKTYFDMAVFNLKQVVKRNKGFNLFQNTPTKSIIAG